MSNENASTTAGETAEATPMTKEQITKALAPLLKPCVESFRKLVLATTEKLTEKLHPADLFIYETSVGWSFTGKADDLAVHLQFHPKHINLGFNQGSTLDDPAGKLKGKTGTSRHVHLASAAALDDKDIVALLDAAVAAAPKGDSSSKIHNKAGAPARSYADHQ